MHCEKSVNVSLRDVLERDLPILFEHQIDPVANRMVAFTPRDENAFMAHWRKILADPTVNKKVVLFDRQVAGHVVSFERSGKREIGYWIGREHWGKGIATEALRQFLRQATERPLYGVVAKHNTASIRVLEKCGFVLAGRSRGSPGGRGPAVEELILKLSDGDSADPDLRVTYELACAGRPEAERTASEIALEQTVELPADVVRTRFPSGLVGRVDAVRERDDGRWEAEIAYPLETVGSDVPQLWNLLFGNISLKAGIRLRAVGWPSALLHELGGPQYGVGGLRRLCGVDERRPLLCAALKPMGLSAGELARLCGQFAAGGIDLVKDDHGLVDQPSAPFDERVTRCQAAAEETNARTGGTTLYLPNVTAGVGELARRVEFAAKAGCRGVLLSPLPAGPDSLRWIARNTELAILAHPSLSGAYLRDDHGLAPELLLGELFRILGADGVIYPNAGGRFPFSEETCAAIHAALRKPLGPIEPAFPMLGGGIEVDRVPHWIERYGPDTVFLIGGSLYARDNLSGATRDLLAALRAAAC